MMKKKKFDESEHLKHHPTTWFHTKYMSPLIAFIQSKMVFLQQLFSSSSPPPSSSSHIISNNKKEYEVMEHLFLLKCDENIACRFVAKNAKNRFVKTINREQIIENDVDCKMVASNVRFITVQYSHPKMKETIDMNLADPHFTIGNELYSSSFVLRFLQHQPKDYLFDDDYVIHVIDSNVNVFELKHNQYIYIGKDNYMVKTI